MYVAVRFVPDGPLTPALSPSEGARENHSPSQPASETVDSTTSFGDFKERHWRFPLPRRGGEGQGEGAETRNEHPTLNIELSTSNGRLTPALSPSEGEREN